MAKDTSEIHIFGLHLINTTMGETVDFLAGKAKEQNNLRVNFVNAHCVNIAAKNMSYLKALHNSQLYADGIGMSLAAKLAGERFIDNINGTDLFPEMCKKASQLDLSIALVGSQKGVAEKCAQNMMQCYPGLHVGYTHHGFFKPEEEQSIVEAINKSGVDILFLALGVPKQELFIEQWNSHLKVGIQFGVGALFDFYSGNIPRAPLWMRKSGLEWLFRLYQEPVRLFNRYVIGNFIFLGRAVFLRLSGKETLQKKPLGPSTSVNNDPQ